MAAFRLRSASRLSRLFSEVRVSQSSLRPARRLKASLTSGEATRVPVTASTVGRSWRPYSAQGQADEIVDGGKLSVG